MVISFYIKIVPTHSKYLVCVCAKVVTATRSGYDPHVIHFNTLFFQVGKKNFAVGDLRLVLQAVPACRTLPSCSGGGFYNIV